MKMYWIPIVLFSGLALGCADEDPSTPTAEGVSVGDCSDGADNDGDGDFDCDDSGCSGAPVCNGASLVDAGGSGPGCEQTSCGEQCVDTQNDDAHCGGCDLACPTDFSCLSGTCTSVVRATISDPSAGALTCNEVCQQFEAQSDCSESCQSQALDAYQCTSEVGIPSTLEQIGLQFSEGTTGAVQHYCKVGTACDSPESSLANSKPVSCDSSFGRFRGQGSCRAERAFLDCCCTVDF